MLRAVELTLMKHLSEIALRRHLVVHPSYETEASTFEADSRVEIVKRAITTVCSDFSRLT